MDAGPRDRAQENPVREDPAENPVREDQAQAARADLAQEDRDRLPSDGPHHEAADGIDGIDAISGLDGLDGLEDLHAVGGIDGVDDMGGMGVMDGGDLDGAASFRELRPERRLRVWQLAPIVALAAVGSLMFAFPLAFEFGEGGAVVAMLGLLISCCAAGWGMMAARRVGYTWPGLPERGSCRGSDWRVVLAYTVVVVAVVVLAVWRVARLR
jgi:hypothetical protein